MSPDKIVPFLKDCREKALADAVKGRNSERSSEESDDMTVNHALARDPETTVAHVPECKAFMVQIGEGTEIVKLMPKESSQQPAVT
ncbi:MAG: hypothetical protein GY820_00585 [Gammaproteobacteria bacterium]|nr:hypothetical protein [Gammaproteobacteria bacterium]